MSSLVPAAGTIHEVLTRKNPKLHLNAKKASVSKNDKWLEHKVKQENVLVWTDFTLEVLKEGWGHLLEVGNVQGQVAEEISETQQEIVDENHVDTIAENWNIKAVRDSIKQGALVLREKETPRITISKHRTKHTGDNPDMSVYFQERRSHGPTQNKRPQTVVAIGDNKTSVCWTSQCLLQREMSEKAHWPLRQINHYCVSFRTRYAWIMSDEELVAFRISYLGAMEEKTMRLEYQTVPWSAFGPEVMTVNLAMWWLSMMGIKERYRGVVRSVDMLPINMWWEEKVDGQTTGFKHILSGRTIDSTQPRPSATMLHPFKSQGAVATEIVSTLCHASCT